MLHVIKRFLNRFMYETTRFPAKQHNFPPAVTHALHISITVVTLAMPFLTHLSTTDPAPLIPRHKGKYARSSQKNETSR